MSLTPEEFLADVAFIYTGSQAKGAYGSGRLIAPRLVLTAGHVVDYPTRNRPRRKRWKVCLLKERSKSGDWTHRAHKAELLWRGAGELDLALLKVCGDTDLVPTLPPVFASYDLLGSIPDADAAGFPEAWLTETGRLRDYTVRGNLRVAVQLGPYAWSVPPADKPDDPQGWKGMSGAAVCHAGSDDKLYVLGVVQQVPADFSGGLLEVAKISGGFSDAAFLGHLRAALGKESGIVAWQIFDAGAVRPLTAQYPFPKVGEADCYELLGVAMSELVDRYRSRGALPPYIPRDIDEQIIAALNGSRPFLLLIGPSAAGKTRTAYEMLRHVPEARLLVPRRPDCLSALIEAFESLPDRSDRFVLWLDGLERFLAAGHLTSFTLTAAFKLGLRIVATGRAPKLGELLQAGDRSAQDVLDRAEIVQLPDRMSTEEGARAERLYPGRTFDEGIGESFIAGSQLRRRFDFGTPEMVAVTRAAADWERVGCTAPIRHDQLQQLFEPYFQSIEPLLDPGPQQFERGISQARQPVARYAALLTRQASTAGFCFLVPDHITEYIEAKRFPILDATWDLAIRSIDAGATAASIGSSASARHLPELAERAWKIGAQREDGVCASRLGQFAQERGDIAQAEECWRKSSEFGNGDGMYNLGVLLHLRGEVAEAERLWRASADMGVDTAAYSLGLLLEQKDDAVGAAQAWERVSEHGDPEAAASLGGLRYRQGDPDGAEQAWRRSLALGSPAGATNLGELLKLRGDIEGARQAWRAGAQLFGEGSPLLAKLDMSPLRGLRIGNDVPPQLLKALRRALQPGGERAAELLRDLGLRLASVDDPEGAELAWQTGLERKYADCAYNLGRLRHDRHDLPGATIAWRRGMELGSRQAAYHLGALLLGQGDEAGALSAWETALSLRSPEAAYSLGTLLFHKRQDPQGAEQMWRKGIELGSAESAEQLVILLKSQSKTEEMGVVLKKAIELGSQKALDWLRQANNAMSNQS
jgi:tetratricopeptide (TPR) repeat protein